ncbi:MAG: hypothetical protein HOG94_03170 [Nitrospinaceae bacterium]|nr:hypothetical protein [Nitrospinaceae bacterium]
MNISMRFGRTGALSMKKLTNLLSANGWSGCLFNNRSRLAMNIDKIEVVRVVPRTKIIRYFGSVRDWTD